jgi:heme-degrading monooxygenase HmoA
MAEMMMMFAIREGAAEDLDQAIWNDERWADAGRQGLIDYQILIDAESPERASILTKWHDLESLRDFEANPDRLAIREGSVRTESAGKPTVFVSPPHRRKLRAAGR